MQCVHSCENIFKMKLVASCLVLLFAAASAENLVELATRLGATELVKLVTEAGLGSTIATGGRSITVFECWVIFHALVVVC